MHLGTFSNIGQQNSNMFFKKSAVRNYAFSISVSNIQMYNSILKNFVFVFPFSFEAWTVHSELFEITETQIEYAFTCLPKCFLQEDWFKHLQTSNMLLPYTIGLYFTDFILFKEINYKLWTQRLEYLRCGRWMGLLKVP